MDKLLEEAYAKWLDVSGREDTDESAREFACEISEIAACSIKGFGEVGK